MRELRQHLSEALRYVQAGGTIEITNRGEVIAFVIPARPQPGNEQRVRAAIADLDRLAAEISAISPKDVSAIDVVNDIRRGA